MNDPANTRPSLLIRVRDLQDRDAWRQFVELYGPLVYRFAWKRGLQEADAADLSQTVLQAVAEGIQRFDYDPGKGTFRGWLYGVVRHQLRRYLVAQGRQPQGAGDSSVQELLEQQPARDNGEADLWEQEYQRQLFRWAAERVRGCFEETSWQAFWQTAVEGKAARETADALGISVGAVYTAKSRVLGRIRQEIQQLLGE
jgi:RNA polymerase sigma-70 factor (ECF subfamily)